MKKYTTNKSKLILATLTIPMIVSTLPVENVFAADNDIKNVNVYELNGSPKLEWATEILQENVILKTDFSSTSMLPTLGFGNVNGDGGQTYKTYGSNRYLSVTDTISNGNLYYAPITSHTWSGFTFPTTIKIQNGEVLSMSFKAKTSEGAKSQILPSSSVPTGNYPVSLNSIEKIKYKNTTDFTKGVPETFEVYTDSGNLSMLKDGELYYITTGDGYRNYGAVYYKWDAKNKKFIRNASTITNIFSSNVTKSFKAGDEVQTIQWIGLGFNARTIENTQWETYNINTLVTHDNYNFNLDGFKSRIDWTTNGTLDIDDVTFGYATQVEVFRDGLSVYKGYLSDFHDTTAKDKTKPNQVTKVNTTIGNDFKVKFTPVKPSDNGTTYNYQLQTISKSNTRGALSSNQAITLKGDVVKYKYSITKSSEAPSTLTNTTTGLDFNVSLNTLNLEEDYIHVQAVDTNGNVSSVQTFKIADIINMNDLNNLYNKLKGLEDSENYTDFIEFLDEVESAFGDNLPQDIKDRIQQLATIYGENTTFLQLLEGDFSLVTKDITSFGKVKLTAEKQVLKTNFADNFTVIDARGTQQGWKVNVSATSFIEDTFEGFIGEPTQLPIGTLAVNKVHDIQQVGLVHDSKLPSPFTNDFTIIDSGEVTVLNANKGYGMGEFKFNFGEDALSMVVDSTTAKIDNKNYPDGITPYTSTITWNLITGP